MNRSLRGWGQWFNQRFGRLRPPRGVRLDLAIALGLALLGGLMGGVFVGASGQGHYYQTDFAPAVMQACGHGFTDYDERRLHTFLARESDSYTCPDPYVKELRSPATLFAQSERYLFSAASLLWWIDEITWDALMPLFAAMFALTSVGLYALFRLISSPPIAVVGAFALMTSPGYLSMLPELRDFSKAPFMLIGFALVALLVMRAFSVRGMALIGAGLGLTLGIGFGFRSDVLAIFPVFLMALLLFSPSGLRRDMRGRAAALGAFVIAFVIAAMPLLIDFARSGGPGNATFLAIHGSTAPFNTALGVEQDLYTPGYLYNDSYATSLINAHAYRIDGYRKPVGYQTAELERYSQSLYVALARNFPADWLIRARAATERVLELGDRSTVPLEAAPSEVDVLGVPSALRNLVGDNLGRLGGPFLLPLLALLLAAWLQLRSSLFALSSGLFFCALSTIQFGQRHVFYLEVLWWLAAAFLVERLIRGVLDIRRRRRGGKAWLPERKYVEMAALRVGVVVLILLVVSVGLLAPARAYQDRHVERLLERYEGARRTPLKTVEADAGPGRTLVSFAPVGNPVWEGPVGGVRSALFVASFSRAKCRSLFVDPIARYKAADTFEDWSTRLDVRLPSARRARVNLYFLGFESPATRLAGIELPTEQRGCLDSVAAVDTRELPVLLYATLPDDWRNVTRHATLARHESRRGVYEDAPVIVSTGLTTPLVSAHQQGVPYRWDDVVYSHPEVHFTGSGWSYDGDVENRFSYLVQSSERRLSKGDFVVVRGVLKEGGVTIGLLRDAAWATFVNVTDEGEFYATIEAPDSAAFALVVANSVPSDESKNRIRITKTYWDVPAATKGPTRASGQP